MTSPAGGGAAARATRLRPTVVGTLLCLLGGGGIVGGGTAPVGAQEAQQPGSLQVTVVDGVSGEPVVDATVTLERPEPKGNATPIRRATTGTDGSRSFGDLHRDRYRLRVERFGYRSVALDVDLDRTQPLRLSVVVDPVPFPLGPVSSRVARARGPSLGPPAPGETAGGTAGNGRVSLRAAAIGVRQRRFLAPDVRQISHDDLREANAPAEDDLFRGLQRLPGVASRDDFTVDLWSRGAAAAHTTVLFDGIPVLGSLHALGAVSGLNTDMLGTATFQPGVAAASYQGGGAAVLDVTSRSGVDAVGSGRASLSPLSLRVTLNDRPTDRFGWAVGVRRSHVDALARVARGMGIGTDSLPYSFADVTGRVDYALGSGSRIELSGYWQGDRIFGDVPDVAYGNEGDWGTGAARASVGTVLGDAVLRTTVGLSVFDATVATRRSAHTPLHPPTANRYRTLVWESRLDGVSRAGEPWSVGIRASREDHDYRGPGLDLARLLSPEELARRGIVDLLPLIRGLERARMTRSDRMTRAAAWGSRTLRLSERIEVEGGVRVETGDPVQGRRLRLAPRLQLRLHGPDSRLSVAAGYGRAYQYVHSLARTDVVRPGLRVSEVFAQADDDTPALQSDVLTVGGEVWAEADWLLGATLWHRSASGALVPEPTPGVIDDRRGFEPAAGRAYGLELSARKVAGRVRGFANYSLSRSRHRVRTLEFDASEDRRHVANMGVTADATSSWRVGGTFRAQSGAPYTRITLIGSECGSGESCVTPPVLYGTPGGQRAPAYVSLDLMAAWTHDFPDWSLSVYGQLLNVLGNANRVTYHSSCICGLGGDGHGAELSDRFDGGLPRLPLIGVRARF